MRFRITLSVDNEDLADSLRRQSDKGIVGETIVAMAMDPRSVTMSDTIRLALSGITVESYECLSS